MTYLQTAATLALILPSWRMCQPCTRSLDLFTVVQKVKAWASAGMRNSNDVGWRRAVMEEISWGDFEKVELRVGTIIAVNEFPEARRPAWKLTIDFGAEIGIRKSSAQITELYSKTDLIGKQVVAVVNFPPKQIGPFMSECLVTGFNNSDGAIVLISPDVKVPNGQKLI
jgi:tRNA-binding protein